jgi:hypothetical protein
MYLAIGSKIDKLGSDILGTLDGMHSDASENRQGIEVENKRTHVKVVK